MQIAKTDYLNYLQCPEFAWLQKHKPEAVDTEPTPYEKKLIRDGYEVEEYAQELFPEGEKTKQEFSEDHLPEKDACLFQPTFVAKSGLETRCDILTRDEDGVFDLFEVKSSTRVKRKADKDYIRDVAFQVIVLEACGCDIGSVHVIHLNGDYIRGDTLNLDKLFVVKDVSDQVNKIKDKVSSEIQDLKTLMQKDALAADHCSCRYETKTNHCDAFSYFNGSVDKDSVYNLPYLRKKKLKRLLERGIEDMKDMPESFDLSDRQQICVQAAKKQEPQINEGKLKEHLSNYKYPLHFLDYETFQPAVPKLEGASPHKHITFQASLHVLDKTGELTHYEYLNNELSHPRELVVFLQDKIGDTGSIVVWHDTFEKNRNQDMAERFPNKADFLQDINNRIVDLKDIFQEDYVHPDTAGSASIKDVLPALLPDFSYEDLEIQDGTMAMQAWEEMVTKDLEKPRLKQRRQELLNYCEMDTLAMVRLYQYVRDVVGSL